MGGELKELFDEASIVEEAPKKIEQVIDVEIEKVVIYLRNGRQIQLQEIIELSQVIKSQLEIKPVYYDEIKPRINLVLSPIKYIKFALSGVCHNFIMPEAHIPGDKRE